MDIGVFLYDVFNDVANFLAISELNVCFLFSHILPYTVTLMNCYTSAISLLFIPFSMIASFPLCDLNLHPQIELRSEAALKNN